jgi:hypothetical protein
MIDLGIEPRIEPDRGDTHSMREEDDQPTAVV